LALFDNSMRLGWFCSNWLRNRRDWHWDGGGIWVGTPYHADQMGMPRGWHGKKAQAVTMQTLWLKESVCVQLLSIETGVW
jgi:hypothetical protein